MTDAKIRCIHRHDIEHHPKCFKLGRILQADNKDMKKKMRQELTPTKYKRINIVKEPWYMHDDYTFGYFDIETSNFTANNGYMISYAIKERDNDNIIYNEITQKEVLAKEFDKRLVRECLADLAKFNIWVTYYGTGFDLPFLRTRAESWYRKERDKKEKELRLYNVSELKSMLEEILPDDRRVPSRFRKSDIVDMLLDRDEDLISFEFPEYGSVYHFDLYYLVRAKFKLHRNSLGVATEFFGIDGKTHLRPEEWMMARIADPDIMPVVKEHNLEDVVILEKLHEIVNPYRKWTRKSI